LFAGTPAQANWFGCQCYKSGAAPVCMPGLFECMGTGGFCLTPCDCVAPKKVVKHHKKKAKAKKRK
jgi:hypothetical protein